MSRSPNDGLKSKEDLICQTKLNMAAKFVENFIFLWGIGERNDVYNLEYHLYNETADVLFYNTLCLKIHKAAK